MSEIIGETEQYVVSILTQKLKKEYLYHNLRHTQRVVKSTKELLKHSSLDRTGTETVLLAAWLHDTGYTMGAKDHEKHSCAIARAFLEKKGYDPAKLRQVLSCILATQPGAVPKTEHEKIMRDADASHFAKNSYLETADILREELRALGLASYSRKEWLKMNIALLRDQHEYYTEHAKEHWQPKKEKNIKRMLKDKRTEKEIAKKEALKAKYKNESPDRGIQTLFRVTLKNHITLSDIADTKANILLSVNAIIISLALSNLIPKLDNPSNDYLIYPTAIFICFSIASMILAIMATRPNVTTGSFTKTDVEQKKVNLLFFGNFHKMNLEQYQWAMNELVKDKDYIYTSLTKDLYFLGVVLHRKYKLLRYTYTIFMIGMIVSVLAFALAFKFFGPERTLETVGLS